MSKRLSQKNRKFVAKRAQHCCEYCVSLRAYSPDPFCVEHIFPISQGGTSDLENLAYSCNGCNNYKYAHTTALDPLTGIAVPLFHPRNDIWDFHFRWSPDSKIIVGITPIGRATVTRMKLNRLALQNQRGLLFDIGKHPPF